MSIIIHGFYKPNRCRYCPFCIPTERDRDDSPYECVINSSLHWATWTDVPNFIPEGCKISGIPTHHGDLIDRDELVSKLIPVKDAQSGIGQIFMEWLIALIKEKPPTIIEAEQDDV